MNVMFCADYRICVHAVFMVFTLWISHFQIKIKFHLPVFRFDLVLFCFVFF